MAEPRAPESTSRAGDAVRILGGVIIVAVVVGIGLWAERATDDDDLALPDRVIGWSADDSTEVREFAESHSEWVSEAYDADAASAVYAGDLRVLVTAVRAESGPPVPALLEDDQTWVERGEVTCLVTDPPKGAGSTLCQRGDGDLTVRAYAEDTTDADTLVDVTNDVWEDVS